MWNPRSPVRGILGAAALLASALAAPARADQPVGWGPTDRYSLGVMLGVPTGILFEKDVNSFAAVDFGIGALYSPGLRLHTDLLLTLAQTQPGASSSLRLQLGIGIMGGLLVRPCGGQDALGNCSGDDYTGARLPVVVEWWPGSPFCLGLEVAPAIGFNRTGAAALLDAFLFTRVVL